MKIIYTNISPTTNAYTNFNHIFYLKKQKPQNPRILQKNIQPMGFL